MLHLTSDPRIAKLFYQHPIDIDLLDDDGNAPLHVHCNS